MLLKRGLKGLEVKQLQEKLKLLNYYNAAIDGDFGGLTELAVILFQKDHALTADGIVGQQTLNKIEELLSKPQKPEIQVLNNLKFDYSRMVKQDTSLFTHTVLHYSASDFGDVYDIQKWHLEKGFSGVGYHFIILKNGIIQQGRPLEYIGSHTRGQNKYKIGVCLIGNFNNYQPTKEQIESLNKLLRWLKNEYPNISIVRHKDLVATECPGSQFPFDEIINEVKKVKVVEKDLIYKTLNGYIHILEVNSKKRKIDLEFNGGKKLELETLSSMCKFNKALAGINGGFFADVKGFKFSGAYLDSGLYYTPSIGRYCIIYWENGKFEIRKIDNKELVYLQHNTNFVLEGSFLLVKDGKINTDMIDKFSHGKERHPRTAFGFRKDNTVVMVVVDGRSKGKPGMTGKELAGLMVQLGCEVAVNLDGGGSSSMYYGGKIVNKPSDGKEREIANCLIVY